ncbi:MAG: hypothetical protein IT427_13455 [Pirellulales bacterium]|nr:hypothetical protein [Pirellulales bacterium]
MSLADYNAEPGRVAAVRKQPPNMYTGMLLVAVVALAIGCLFLFLELQSYGGSPSVSSDARVSSVPQAPSPAPDSGAGAMLKGSEFRGQGSEAEWAWA